MILANVPKRKENDNDKDRVKLVYLMGEYLGGGEYNSITGDITFALSQKNGEVIKRSLRGSKAQPILEKTDWYKNNSN